MKVNVMWCSNYSQCCSDCERGILKENRFYELGDACENERRDIGCVEEIPIGMLDKVEKDVCTMQFHMTEAKKMLASVAKITETGNE
eukprot:1702124-Lingulodinium_polyedra.AAC.1